MALKITGEDPAAQHQETSQSEKRGKPSYSSGKKRPILAQVQLRQIHVIVN